MPSQSTVIFIRVGLLALLLTSCGNPADSVETSSKEAGFEPVTSESAQTGAADSIAAKVGDENALSLFDSNDVATQLKRTNFRINYGAKKTSSLTVNLSFDPQNEALQIFITNAQGCAGLPSWRDFNPENLISWSLANTLKNGETAEVFAQFRNSKDASQISKCLSASIVYAGN